MARGGLPAAPNSNPRLPRAIAYCRPKMVLTMGSTLESNTQRGERQPCRSPAPSRIQQHDECGNRAEADAAERYTDPRNPDSTSYLCESSWALLPWIRDRARERKR